MLGEILESLYSNRKKISGAVIGFVISCLYIRYGFLKTLIVVISTLIGYNYVYIWVKLKTILLERLKEN